jgi:hypothetical protein
MTPPELGLVVQEDRGSAIYPEKHASNPESSSSVSLASVPILAGHTEEKVFNRWIEPIDYAAKVIENPDRLRVVMNTIHDGTGHQQFTAIIRHFSERLFPPCTAKLIEDYIRLCHECQQFGRNKGYSPKTRDVSREVKVTAAKVLDAKMPIDNADQAAPETSKKWKDLIALSKITLGIRKTRKDFGAELPLVADGCYIGNGIWIRETIRGEKGLRIVFAPPRTGPYRVQHKGSNRLRSHASEKARSFAQHSQWRDASRHTRVVRCYARLWNDGHVRAAVFSWFSCSFVPVFMFFLISPLDAERTSLLFFRRCVRLGPGSVAESHR